MKLHKEITQLNIVPSTRIAHTSAIVRHRYIRCTQGIRNTCARIPRVSINITIRRNNHESH
jgi:hypothetical protein